MKPTRTADFLDHMIDSIDRIAAYIKGLDRDAFMKNTLVQDAVIRNFEIIGEAARNIERDTPDMVQTNSQIPWRSIMGMRNQLSHGYFNVDQESVWATIADDLPKLRQTLLTLRQREAARRLADMGGSEPDALAAPRRRPWEE